MAETLSMGVAVRICLEVQKGQLIKIFTQCWGCTAFSKGDPAKMCGGLVACNLVLSRYRKQQSRQTTQET